MKQKIFPVLFIAFILAILFVVGRMFSDQEIKQFIQSAGIFAPIAFVLLLLITLIIAPFSGTPVVYAGFYAFGHKAIYLVILTSYISFVTNFWIARFWGRNIVIKLAGEGSLEKLDELTKNYGFSTLAILRIFQGSVNDFISFAAGLTKMDFVPYIVVSLIASIPGNLVWYYISLQVRTPEALALAMFVVAGAFSFIYVFGVVVYKKIRS